VQPVLFFMLIIGVVAAVLLFSYFASEQRRKELSSAGERLGLFFAPDADGAHMSYIEFYPFGRGQGQRCTNLLHGQRGELVWEIFDYKYTTGSGKNRQTHNYGIAAARVPMLFRHLQIRPEGWFDKIVAMVGIDDINFESEEFSRRYHVSCDVRKFAYDIIHPQMIEFLLGCPAMHWQIRHDVILIHKGGRFSAHDLERVVEMVEGFFTRIPQYVRQDVAHAGPGPRYG
jgi:hypothetical protein